MKILVYGAGVLGSLYAGKLKLAGQEVSILSRGQRLNDLQEYGIVLEQQASGEQTVVHLPVVPALRPDDRYDLVLVLVRKNQLRDILPALAANETIPSILVMVNNAAGVEELAASVGRERLLFGFPGAGGSREGLAVRYNILPEWFQPTTLGELDGRRSARLAKIAAALREAGFPVAISPNIDAWLKTHVSLVSPIANAVYLAGGDLQRLAHTRDGLALLVRAVREGLRVLQALQIPITPAYYRAILYLPEPLLVLALGQMMQTEWADLVIARHANSARDEMGQLADEFLALARQSGRSVPAIETLYPFLDPAKPPLAAGSAGLRLHWEEALPWLAGLLVVAALLRRKK